MGFTHLIYPTAVHTRFCHSLGVMFQTQKLASEIRNKKPYLIDENFMREIRLAALLHDCGHGLFSHSSEEYYKDYPEMIEIYSTRDYMKHASPHEVLSSLILQTETFREFISPFMGIEIK